MNHTQEITLLGLVHTIRRTVRVLERVREIVTEDDLKQKFSRFTSEHMTLLEQLKHFLDLEDHAIQSTPQAFLQFPSNHEELLGVAAKSERQAIDEVNRTIAAKVNPEATKILKQYQPKLVASYDYIQALYDLLN